MKNPLQEILNKSSTVRASSTLEPKQALQLPPLVEQRSSLIGKPPRHQSTHKRFLLNNSEPKLRKELPESNSLALHHFCDIPTEDCIDKLIRLILEKGKRTPEFLNTNRITGQDFVDAHFRGSATIRVQLKSVLQKLLSKGQVGIDLKGINKNIMDRIQQSIAPCLENERDLYRAKTQFSQKASSLSKDIEDYRRGLRSSLSDLLR